MRKGKMIAQGAHASLKAYLFAQHNRKFRENATEWALTMQTKICVSVDSLPELKAISDAAETANLPYSYVIDAGLTEFSEPTPTAVAIGPAESEEIDKITGKLKLL